MWLQSNRITEDTAAYLNDAIKHPQPDETLKNINQQFDQINQQFSELNLQYNNSGSIATSEPPSLHQYQPYTPTTNESHYENYNENYYDQQQTMSLPNIPSSRAEVYSNDPHGHTNEYQQEQQQHSFDYHHQEQQQLNEEVKQYSLK